MKWTIIFDLKIYKFKFYKKGVVKLDIPSLLRYTLAFGINKLKQSIHNI